MVKICFAIQKGGDGKSTSTISLSSYLALNGHKVLVVDFDGQANTTSVLLGRKSQVSFENVVRDDLKASDVIFKSQIDNLDILPANPKLLYAQDPLKNGEAGGGEALRNFIEDNNLEEKYDYGIFDTPHSSAMLHEVALIAADYVVIPVTPSKFSMDGLIETKKKIERIQKDYNEHLELIGVFLNKYVANRNYIKGIELDLQEYFGDKFLRSRVRNNSSIEQAFLNGKPIFLFSIKSIGAQDFTSLCEEIIDRITVPALEGVGR